jgi:hypothetical protein
MTLEDSSENRSSVDSAVSIEIVSIDDRTEQYCIQTNSSSGQRPSTAIIEAIGTITDTDPIELDPLGDTIDSDHLDGLFDSPSNSEREHVSVSFSYAGYRITVSETKAITRTPIP